MGTVTPEGLPHLTLITTLMASDAKTVVWGQFMEGMSKQHVQKNPKVGFMIMSLAKDVWRGKANYTVTCQKRQGLRVLQQHPALPLQRLFRRAHRALHGSDRADRQASRCR